MNLYAYAGNSPISYDDPFGLWDPGTHDVIIMNALGDDHEDDANLLKGFSRDFDNKTQDPQLSFMHGMAAHGQSPGNEAARTESWIQEHIVLAKELQTSGNHKGAMKELAVAMHAMMDKASPWHRDKNGTPKVWKGKLRSGPAHLGEVGAIPNQQQMAGMVKQLQGAYSYVMGN